MEGQSGLSELSVISWVSAVEGCPLGGVSLYTLLVSSHDSTFLPIHTHHPFPPIFLQYMVQVLHAGDNMEFFIEGSRSRSGKPGMPKAGLLSVLVDSVKEGT